MEQKRPSQIITLKPQFKNSSSQYSPNSPSGGRRRKKLVAAKTSEELLYDSYQQLIDYVDKFDAEVKKVVESYESEFLNAYREHIKKVKIQLNEIKKNSLQVMKQEQHFVERIEILEKQLALFREDSLKLSEKNIELNQELQRLNFQLKQSQEEVIYMERSLASAIKENKRAAVVIQSLKEKKIKEQFNTNQQIMKISSIHKTIPTTDISHLQNLNEERQNTMSVRFNNKRIKLGIQSMKKQRLSKQESEEKSHLYSSQRKSSKPKDFHKDEEFGQEIEEKLQSEHLGERKERLEHLYAQKSSQNNQKKFIEDELKRLRSQNFVTRNQYQKIFIDCVEEVRKEILRKNGITGLNFFKNNGSKTFLQFKQVDYHMILYLFLKNEEILHVFFDLLFSKRN